MYNKYASHDIHLLKLLKGEIYIYGVLRTQLEEMCDLLLTHHVQ